MLANVLRAVVAVAVGVAFFVGGQAPAAHAAAVTLPLRVNFQPQTSVVPAGYLVDYGQAFDVDRGYGWFNGSHVATSFTGNTRDRNTVSDQRIDTFSHMQLPAGSVGTSGTAIWKASVPNGTYRVTIGVGDPWAIDSHDVINAEGGKIVDFTPTTAQHNTVVTATVAVNDTYLTIDPLGGINTKIDFIDVFPATAAPYATSVDPYAGAADVPIDKAVTVQLSAPVNPSTLSAGLKLYNSAGVAVSGFYNTDGAASNATFVPSGLLAANTTYRVETNGNLKTATGMSYAPFTSAFTTGTSSTQTAGVAFNKSTFSNLTGVTAMTLGPGNTLYAATGAGVIKKYALTSTGQVLGSPTDITAFENSRTITGMRFDPSATASAPKLWVSSGALCQNNCANFTGMISVLTGATTPTVRRDVITGLPRSVRDHMTNGIEFGPDNRLYIAQGSLSGYGAPDANWGNRAETPLSASILVADVRGDARFASTVNVNTSVGYDPLAVNAPVKIYAEGIRNAFSVVWHSNGKLYTAVNESASGNAPAGPNNNPPALTDLPAYNDYFTQVVQGKYYGHPNPSRGTYRLNGGNPTAGADPFQVSEYAVGVTPEANWRKPDLDLGAHRSPNGTAEFRSTIFGTRLAGRILVTEYSQGKDVIAVQLDGSGNATGKTVVASGFYNPIAIASDATSGRTYVGEYGSDPDGVGGQITLLTPVP
jgi:glucose/arabinose dehydrogenase